MELKRVFEHLKIELFKGNTLKTRNYDTNKFEVLFLFSFFFSHLKIFQFLLSFSIISHENKNIKINIKLINLLVGQLICQ